MPGARKAALAELGLRVESLVDVAKGQPVDDAALMDAERVARVVDLAARVERHPPWRRLAVASAFAAAVGSATCSQPSADVRVRVVATAAEVTVAGADAIPFNLASTTTSLGGFAVVWASAELRRLLDTSGGAEVVLRATPPAAVRLQHWKLPPTMELSLISEPEHVELSVDCRRPCADSRLLLSVRGRLQSGQRRATAVVPSSIVLAPRGRHASVRLLPPDSTTEFLTVPIAISAISFHRSSFQSVGGVTALRPASTIRSGVVSLRDYPSRTWTLTAGDQIHLGGDRFRLLSVRRHADALLFDLGGEVSALRLGRQDLRPTLWDWVYTSRYWPIVAAFVAGLGGWLASYDAIRGRRP